MTESSSTKPPGLAANRCIRNIPGSQPAAGKPVNVADSSPALSAPDDWLGFHLPASADQSSCRSAFQHLAPAGAWVFLVMRQSLSPGRWCVLPPVVAGFAANVRDPTAAI